MQYKVSQVLDSYVIDIAEFSQKSHVMYFLIGCLSEMSNDLDLVVEDVKDPNGEMLTALDFFFQNSGILKQKG